MTAEIVPDRAIAQNLPRWIAVFQRLIRCTSTFEHEHAAIAVVEEELKRIGFSPVAVEFEPAMLMRLPGSQPPYSPVPGRRNLVAKLPGRGGGRSIILNCHLDVVPADDSTEWTYPPFSGEIAGNAIYGRGSYDDKAGAVICLALLDLFSTARERLAGDIIVQFVLEDEITGNGSLLCLHAGHVADAAIIIDGTRGSSGINAHAGNIRFGVRVRGEPASVGVSHMGSNAAEMLARLLLELREAVFGLNARNTALWKVFPSPNQLSTLSLHCDETLLTVPADASAVCYATFTPPMTLATFRSMIEAVARDFTESHQLPHAPAFDWNAFATEPVASASVALEQTIGSAARKVSDKAISFGPSTGSSDLRHFAARGIPCVLFGPGVGYNPHRANEHFQLESLSETVRILFCAVDEWCR